MGRLQKTKMEATKAVITVQGIRVQVDENVLAAFNQALVDCPSATSTYGDSKPENNKRLTLVPTLTIETKFTTIEL